MKLNRKGFMMAEVVVVSSVILIVLTTLYISYNKIFSLYETRLNYEDSNLIYSLAYYRDYLIDKPETGTYYENLGIHNKLSRAFYDMENNNENYCLFLTYYENYLKNVNLSSEFIDNVYLIRNNKNPINMDLVGGNATYLEYLAYLNTSLDLTNFSYIMVLERKNKNNNTYKYAYLNLEI